jgi:Holliday junction resolvasome RuvABC endonuclease subunit
MKCKGHEEYFETVLAIYPNSKGYAFALMKGPLEIIDKKMVSVSPVDNTQIISEVKTLMKKLSPDVLVLENPNCKYSRKGPRAAQLLRSIALNAKAQKINVFNYSREDVRFVFEIWKAQTKYEIAEVIAKNIKSFRILLYPKPKYPDTQKYITALFDAVSLGITHYYKTT